MNKNQSLFDKVKKIVLSFDPLGIASHAPDDEFDFEVNEIVRFLGESDNLETFNVSLKQMFVDQFGDGTHIDLNKLRDMSVEIWQLVSGPPQKK